VPIHDQSYRHYQGTRQPTGTAWRVIATSGIRSIIRKRRFLGLLVLAWIPFAVRAVQIYLAANYPQATFLAASAGTFREFLEQQALFVFFITIWVGAGLIANDKRANALQIYLSKPLTRAEYVAGKFLILVTFLLMVTWVPGILLLILQLLFAGNFSFVRQNLFLFPAITLYSFFYILVVAFTMLAVSSSSRSSRFVAIIYAGIVFLSDAIYGVLHLVTRSTSLSFISFDYNLQQLSYVIFRLKPLYSTPWPISLLTALAIIAIALFVLERQVRGVEVVT
jgi:ABC-2 type transport system permease protein